jgi:hypothetical protein
MPKDHDESRVKTCSSELDAADLGGRDDVACDSNDEEVAQSLIEDDLRWDPRVRTSEDDRERTLGLGDLCALRRARIGFADTVAGNESLVSGA